MKNRIRKEVLALRMAMTESIIEEKSKKIAGKVLKHPAYQNAELVFCYVDAKNEVGTKRILEDGWKKRKKIAVPRVYGDIMKFHLIESYEELEKGCFGLLEPKKSCEVITEIPKKTVVLMPGVAFDRNGNRIGYGRGYYDRYFSEYPEIYKIAVAFSLQIVPKIPADIFDIKADCVITEESIMEVSKMSKDLRIEEMIDELMEEMNGEEAEEAEEADMITLTMEDGSEVECMVFGIVEVEGQDYIALLPADEEMLERGEGEGFIFRYAEDEEGLPVLGAIEDDEEFEMVSSVLDEIMEITIEEEE